MSLPEELSLRTLDQMIEGLGATEVHGEDGGPFLTLMSSFSPDPVGTMRVFTSPSIPKIVYCGLAVPKFGMDTHMIFGFGAQDSGVPHFTLDSVNANGSLAFHLDMIPRAELAVHVPYMDHVYSGLNDTYNETSKWPGLSKANVGPRQHAMMSPWMLVNRADEQAFKDFSAPQTGPVAQYVAHWLELIKAGIPDTVRETLDTQELKDRDERLRYNLFSPEVDPIWRDVAKIVGDETAEKMRVQLTSNEV